MSTPQILVVEDEQVVALCLQQELEEMGYGVPALASSGEGAVEQAAATRPDLVLMDIMLKGHMDGIEAAEHIRQRWNIPVIFLTAYEDETTLERAKVTGPFGYLLKPYEKGELHTSIEVALCKHRMDRKVKESERWLFATLHCMEEGVIATDAEQRVCFMNPVAETLTGLSAAESYGRELPEVFRVRQEQAPAQGTNENTLDLARNAWLRTRDGKEISIERSDASIRDDDGKFTGSVVVFRDTTERRRLEEQFRHAQKMEAVGRLAGGVAHDFNNLLTAILGYSDLLSNALRPGSDLYEGLVEIKKAGERAASLTRQLLAFSRKQLLQMRVLDLNAIVRDMSNLLRRLLGEEIQLASNLDPCLPGALADAGQIEQVIMNLAVNARDAMTGRGKLTLETANVVLDRADTASRPEVQPGPYVMLAVRDTGSGMDQTTLAHIFEPFFTTKEMGKGTGLGLATVYGIVKQSGGHLTVESEPGRGTTFRIFFPAVGRPAAAPPAAAALNPRGSETVLLVEDEHSLRSLIRRALSEAGYQVLLAEDAEKALSLAGQYRGPLHLLLTDVVMPGMNGRELAQQLNASQPGMKVLYMSGYADEAIFRSGVLPPGVAFLQKPFTLNGLAHKREFAKTFPMVFSPYP